MKLVGATNWFIRWPFVIEGVIVGFFGGLLAVLAADDRQADGGRSAVRPLRAARGTGDDRLPPARDRPDGCLHRSVSTGQRNHVAALPSRLAELSRPRLSLSGRMNSVRSAIVAFLCAVFALFVGIWLGGHPENLPRGAPGRFRGRGLRPARGGDRHDRGQLLQGSTRSSSTTLRSRGSSTADDLFSHYRRRRRRRSSTSP